MSAKITTWNFDHLSIPVDADQEWQEFKLSPFDEQVEIVADAYFWTIQLPWIELPLTVREKFWSEFTAKGKADARKSAVFGLKFVNNLEIFQILQDAMDLERDRIAEKLEKNQETSMARFAFLGSRFAKIAIQKDHRIFRKMANIIEAGGIDGGTKGGEDSFNGQVIRDFCQLVISARSLPTKKQLRESLGLTGEKEDTEKLRVSLKELGLSGLPQRK